MGSQAMAFGGVPPLLKTRAVLELFRELR